MPIKIRKSLFANANVLALTTSNEIKNIKMLIHPGMFDTDYDPNALKRERIKKKIKAAFDKARAKRKSKKKSKK